MTTKFEYLLNAMENAAAQERPADHDYFGKRQAVLKYVAELESEPAGQGGCPDCAKAAKHAYSDATTPGFFYPTCNRHRPSPPASEAAEEER